MVRSTKFLRGLTPGNSRERPQREELGRPKSRPPSHILLCPRLRRMPERGRGNGNPSGEGEGEVFSPFETGEVSGDHEMEIRSAFEFVGEGKVLRDAAGGDDQEAAIAGEA